MRPSPSLGYEDPDTARRRAMRVSSASRPRLPRRRFRPSGRGPFRRSSRSRSPLTAGEATPGTRQRTVAGPGARARSRSTAMGRPQLRVRSRYRIRWRLATCRSKPRPARSPWRGRLASRARFQWGPGGHRPPALPTGHATLRPSGQRGRRCRGPRLEGPERAAGQGRASREPARAPHNGTETGGAAVGRGQPRRLATT